MPEEMTVEEFRMRLAVEAATAIADVQRFRQEVNAAKREIQDLSKQSGENFRFVGETVKKSWGEADKNVKAVSQALKELNQTTQKTGGMFTSLGTIGQFVFGSVLGITAVTAIRKLIDLFGQLTEAAIKFSRAQFQLEVGVRALQRIGMDTTLETWQGQIEQLREEFGLFSKQEITEGVAVSLLKLREFGFTEQQIMNTQRMAATLSLLTGKDFQEEIQGVTYALGSGYFEALQRAGIQISRTIVAQEALKRGFKGAYQSLDDNIRAQLTYDIILRQIQPLEEDSAKIKENLAGKSIALGTAWKDLTTMGGQVLGPFLKELYDILLFGLDVLQKSVTGWQFWATEVFTAITTVIIGIKNFKKVLTGEMDLTQFIKRLREFTDYAREVYQQKFGLKPSQELGNAPIGTPEKEEKPSAEAIMSVHGDDIKKELDKLLELEEDFQQDMAKIDRDGLARRKEIWDDFADRIEDINRKMAQKIADENRDYQQRVADAIEEFNRRRTEIEMRYRNNEITAEARFQERLRQLREAFLMNLEDAVRERDARQVLRLTKQYNLEKQQMIREEKLRKDDAWRQFQLELKMLAMERAAKLRNLEIEHQERLAQIRIQAERERQEAAIDRDRQLEDLATSLARQREERRIKYEEQKKDLIEQIKERLATIAEGLVAEENLTTESIQRIYDILKSYYGPGGAFEEIYKYFFQMLTNMAAAAAGIGAPPGGIPGLPGGIPPAPPDNDEGGNWLITKPTPLAFGGGGPEFVSAIPLGKAGVNVGRMRGGGSLPAGMSMPGDKGSKLQLEVLLSPDLEARIIDTALQEAANAIMSVRRR